MDFAPDEDHEQIVEAVDRVCAAFDDNYWSACDTDHRFPTEFYDAMATRRMDRDRDPRGVRRRRARDHRGRARAQPDRRVGRRDERLELDPPHDVRAQPGREVRQRSPEADVPPARRHRRPPRRVRRDRARRRHRHEPDHDPRHRRRHGRLDRQRSQDLDVEGTRVGGRPPARAHRPRRVEPLRRADAVPRRPRSRLRRHLADPEAGPQRGGLVRGRVRRPPGRGLADGRRARPRIPAPAPRPQPRADPARRDGVRDRRGGGAPRRRLREGAGRVRPADRRRTRRSPIRWRRRTWSSGRRSP